MKLNRLQYWIVIPALLALKLAFAAAIISFPREVWIARYVDVALEMVILIAVVARLRDAGRPAWLGVVGIVFFGIVVPLGLAFATLPSQMHRPGALPDVPGVWIGTVGVLAVVIVVGILRTRRPSGADWSEFSEPTATPEPKRIEPRF
jgi:hypothetical protein